MTTLRTAAQQALTALDGVADALRAALAEPCSHGECFGGECIYTPQSQRPAEPVQEPVWTDLLRLVGNLFAEAYKAGKAAAAEPALRHGVEQQRQRAISKAEGAAS